MCKSKIKIINIKRDQVKKIHYIYCNRENNFKNGAFKVKPYEPFCISSAILPQLLCIPVINIDIG